ncbi:MAG: ion transporter [Bacteroidota bacterium]
MKRKTYNFLYRNKRFVKFIYGLIVLNIVALVLESYKELREPYGFIFDAIEVVSVIIFTVEYFLRIWVADINKRMKKSRFVFLVSPMGIIDLLAILPFYLPLIFTMDLRVVRILRLLRLLRIFKLGRYSKSLKSIRSVFKETKADLSIAFFVGFILMILSSTLMYYIEGEAQPEKFATIGHSFWWAIATLTTVGYGDVYPITAMGKLLSAVITLIGIGFIALPTGIISSAFIEKIKRKKRKRKRRKITCTCPNCGTTIKV